MGRRARRCKEQSADGTPSAAAPLDRFLAGLAESEKLLIQLKQALYEGSWDKLEGDLRARLEGRTYVYKLAGVIKRDLESIRRMREFERLTGADLAEALARSEKARGTG